jgi:hypothetical protein
VKGVDGAFCFDERRLPFFEDSSKLDTDPVVGDRPANWVGVGDRKIRLPPIAGEPISTPDIEDMGRGDSNEEVLEKLELKEFILECPGPIKGESGSAGDRSDRAGCSEVPLESLIQLASRLCPGCLEFPFDDPVVHVTLDGVPGRAETAIG